MGIIRLGLVIVIGLVVAGAAGADIVNWMGYDWDADPFMSYVGGDVTIGVDGHLYTWNNGASKITWFLPYGEVDPLYQERFAFAKFIWPADKVGKKMKALQINVYDGNKGTLKPGWAVVLKNELLGSVVDFGVRSYFATGKIRAMVYDPFQADPPRWSGNDYFDSRLRTGSDYFYMFFTFLPDDRVAVDYVANQLSTVTVASWTSPVALYGGLAEIYLTASVNAAPAQSYFKWTKFAPVWEDSPVAGINGRAARDSVMTLARSARRFKVWGKVLAQDFLPDSFLVDDGSGLPIGVYAPGHMVGIDNIVEAVGVLRSATSPPTLVSDSVSVRVIGP